MRKTDDVRELVTQVLQSLPQPYGRHVIDDVFQAIDSNDAWRSQYYRCAAEFGTPKLVNIAIGQWVKNILAFPTVKQVPSRKNRLSGTYSILEAPEPAVSSVDSPDMATPREGAVYENVERERAPRAPRLARKNYDVWLTFESRLAERVRGLLRPGLTFTAGRQCISGYPADGFRADAALTNGRVLLAVEVEVRQTHPDTNVGKYWLLNKHHRYEKVLLVHVYTPAYDSYGWRKQLGEFYAQKMGDELSFEYVMLDRRSDTDVEVTLNEVWDLVEASCLELFASELKQ